MNKSLLKFSFALLLMVIVSSVNAQTRTATASGNWNNTATWGGASVPTSVNDVVINNGVTVTVTANAQCLSVNFRSASGALSVNTGITLDVTNAITLENTAATSTAATLSGAGTITCGSIVVGGNVTAVTGNNLTNTLTSTVANLDVSGGISINGEDNGSAESNGTFLISTGTVTVGGTIALDSDNDGGSATVTLSMNSATDNGVLVLTNATPITTTGIGTETLDFTTTGNTTVEYAGAAQTVAAATYRNLIFSGSGSKASGGTVTVGLKLSLQGTATVGSTITYSTAILEYKGTAAQTTSNNEFAASTNNVDEVIIDNAAGVTLNGAKTLNGDLTLTAGQLTAGNNLTMGGGGTPLITRAEGSITGTLQSGNDYDVIYTGNSKTAGAELSGTGFSDVTVSLTAGQTLTLDQNRAPDGNLAITSGILDLSTFTFNRSSNGGTLTLSNGATLRIGGTNSFPTNYSTHSIGSTSPFSTVEYDGTNQTIGALNSGQSYGHLTLSGSGVKNFTGARTVNGVLSMQGTATTTGTTPTYGANAILEYKGSSAQNTSSVEFGGTGANPVNLRIDNTNGVTLNAAKNINGALTLTNGYLTTTSALLTINANGSASTSNGAFVNGPLAKVKNTTARFDFPVGNLTGGLRIIGVAPVSTTSTTYTATFNTANPRSVAGGTNLNGIAQISACEYWNLTRSAGTNAQITLSWPAAVNSCGTGAYVGNVSSLIVASNNGSNWINQGQSANTGSPSLGGTVTSSTAAANFTSFVLGTTDNNANPLPVMFADVKAFQKNSGVQVEWTNLTERDLIGYSVERSANGVSNFVAVSQVAPRTNNNDKESYFSYDASPISGVNYYRVKAQEVSGKIIYSKVLKVDLTGKQSGISLYPNPVVGSQLSIFMNAKQGQYNVQVSNSAGQQILTQRMNHQGGSITQTVELPSTVKPGVYNITVTGDNYRASKTFIVQ